MKPIYKTTFEFAASQSVVAATANGKDAGYAVKLFRDNAEDPHIIHLPPDATSVTIEAPEGQHLIVLVAARVGSVYSKAEPFEYTSRKECLPLGPGRLEMKNVQVPVSLPLAPHQQPGAVRDANDAIKSDMIMVNGHRQIIDGSEGAVNGRTPNGHLVAVFSPECIRGFDGERDDGRDDVQMVIARDFENGLVAISGRSEVMPVDEYLDQHGDRLIVITAVADLEPSTV